MSAKFAIARYGVAAVAMVAMLLIVLVGAIPFPRIALAQDTTDKSLQTATGCLRKNAIGNTYALTDENGKLWDLRSQIVPLNRHVGQTVEVTGTIPKESGDSSDTSPQNHLVVTKLDMVRDSCKQP